MNKDLYKILEMSEEDKRLNDDEFNKKLKRNYRRLSREYHPDKQSGKSEEEKKAAEEKFKECVEAYDVLSNKDKRYQYDNFGTTDNRFQSSNMDDILKEFMKHGFGGFDGFEGFGNFGNGMNHNIVKGSDIMVNVKISIKELFEHNKKTIKYNRYKHCTECHGNGYSKNGSIDICPHCHGSGMIMHTQQNGFAIYQTTSQCPYCNGSGHIVKDPCTRCNGTGLERAKEEFTFDLPFGISNHARIRISGNGNYPQTNNKIDGVNGDLILQFIIEDNSEFKIDDFNPFDLYMIKEVSILDCITGCEDIITAIDGKKYKYNIPKNCEQDTVVRLKGKGLPYSNGSYGDLKIKIRHKFPKELNSDEVELINKLKTLENFK